MSENIHQGYWAVVPAPILNDESLPAQAKFLYPVISSLTEKTGYCWASNEYLSKWFGVTERTVSRWVKALEQGGYIRCEMLPTEVGHQRVIYAGIAVGTPKSGGIDKNVQTPRGVDKNVQGGVDKNVQAYIEDDKKSSDNTPHNPPTGGKGRTRKKEPREAPDWEPARFEGLWRFYPAKGKRNKQRAMNAWDKLRPSKAVIDAMAAALKKLAASEEWQKGIGIPHVATFLNNLDDYLGNAEELGEDAADGGQAHTVRSSLPPL